MALHVEGRSKGSVRPDLDHIAPSVCKDTDMTSHLAGKVVVVTGAGSGFGRLVSEMVAARGARVVAVDVDGSTANTTASTITDAGGVAVARAVDVTDKLAMDELAAFAVEQFGAIDVMVNNAGTMPLAFYKDHIGAWSAWNRCIDVNLKGVLHGIIAVYDQMMKQGRGHVVNVSSIYGNFPTAGAAVYTATKAAVNVLSEALRVESQGRIKVTTVKPTGVPGTGLGASVVNHEATIGVLGERSQSFGERVTQLMNGTLPPELADRESPRYWSLSPSDLAEQIVYVLDQPWGVSISEITVRATGEDYLL
jgi:NADP-dependent 3-hydroxy acid dehydrogenase YdfG